MLTRLKLMTVLGAKVVGGVLVLLVVLGVGLMVWYWRRPPKAHYTLLVYNQGRVPIVGGCLAGDSLWRPVAGVRPGRARAFTFTDIPDRYDLDYTLRLVRSDSSRVAIAIGWIDGVWDLTTLSHFVAEVPNDTVQSVGLVLPLDRQTELERSLRASGLIDRDSP